jgi:hypothetical protein
MKARLALTLLVLVAVVAVWPEVSAQSRAGVDPALFRELTWRNIGPLRAGRTRAAVGDPVRPNVLDIGVTNGGVWKTADYGRTWMPIFDSQPTGSIGDIAVSKSNPSILYVATGGNGWEQISPDLTRETWEMPATVGKYRSQDSAKPTRRGVVYSLGPSYRDVNVLWAGTDDGLIHLTRDGGKTWTHLTSGIIDGWPVNVVREDSQRKGLLFAGTEQTVWASFDDGDNWQSLRLNLPATSVRDLIIKDADVASATHGRGFYILDDITPLRQMTAEALGADASLFKPQSAWRWRFNKNTDTPFMPDEPRLPNPPDGALIHCSLKGDARGPVTLEILDAAGSLVRRYSSDDPADAPLVNPNIPDDWIRPWRPLSAKAGMHRFVWDVRYPRPSVLSFSYPIAAVPFNTPKLPAGVWALPGTYTARLSVDGKTMAQPFTLKMDPRVRTSPLGLRAQFDAARAIDAGLKKSYDALMDARAQGEPAQKSAQELQRINRLLAVAWARRECRRPANGAGDRGAQGDAAGAGCGADAVGKEQEIE